MSGEGVPARLARETTEMAGAHPCGSGEKARLAYLAKVRHDLRTPINHILGYCEMLQEDPDHDSWTNLLPDLRKILDGGNQLLALVNYYFDGSKMGFQSLDGPQIQHELRTPLNHIIGYAEILQEQAAEFHKGSAEEDLRKIASAAQLLLELLEKHLLRSPFDPPPWLETQDSVWPLLENAIEPSQPFKHEGATLLIVDDNPLNREMLERRLRRQGFAVYLAASGEEALRLARQTAVDLILLDVVMPDMNGFQVLNQLKSDKVLRHIPVIMLSASDEAATAVQCIKMGADDFLPKPCNTTLLLARFEASLAKKLLRQITKSEAGYYFDKGTLRSDSPSYIERQADKDLFEGLLNRELCYVITSRQMGKSSLMVRTAAKLRDTGVCVVALDLTAVGLNVTPEQWYDGLMTRISRQLRKEDEVEEFWLRHERLSPVQRFFLTLREVGLRGHSRPMVIFVDELDAMRSLPFSTDEFFAAIRECYNRRTEDAEFNRISFCLLGVNMPSDLVQDFRTTPPSIGRQIELADFTLNEALLLAKGLERERPVATALLERIIHWTNGHPYLTQRFCRGVAQSPAIMTQRHVDQLCEKLFLSPKAREEDDNLTFARRWLLAKSDSSRALLSLYLKIRLRPRKAFDGNSAALLNILRLSGVIRTVDDRICVRNRIYKRVFDRHWVMASLASAGASGDVCRTLG